MGCFCFVHQNMFNEHKTTQMAAYFIEREGGEISKLKLMKLLYLAERESLRQHGRVMSGDHLVAMPHGPVLSTALDLANDNALVDEYSLWYATIERKDHITLALRSELAQKDYDELSASDMEILKKTVQEFGGMSPYEIRNYTHHLPEYEDPQGTSALIPYRKILKALNEYTDEEIEAICEQIEVDDSIDKAFR